MTNHQSKTLSDAGSARPFARPCAQGRSPSPEMFRARHRRRRPAESSAPDSIAGPGLKPRRGGLFIANVHTSLLCFCFSAVRLREYRSAEAETPPTSSLVRILRIRAAEKQKQGVERTAGTYKQATRTGFEQRCSAELLSGKDQRGRALSIFRSL